MLSVDANAAYTLADLDHLRVLDDFGLLMIEQPLEHDDLMDHAQLQSKLSTAICLDESITGIKRAKQALDLGSCRIINIKIGRVGGYSQALGIHDFVMTGDTGLVRRDVRVRHWESAQHRSCELAGFVLPGDISASSRYFARDLIVPEVTVSAGGTVIAPLGPGLGFNVDLDYIIEKTENSDETRTALRVVNRNSTKSSGRKKKPLVPAGKVKGTTTLPVPSRIDMRVRDCV
jgi:O-succinylbenzoate synthase